MALENVVEVHNGKVPGAYAAQAKNVSYGNGSVEDALNGLTVDSGWVTVVNNYLYYRKIGKLVEVQINTNGLAVSSSSWSDIGTLPSGARPHGARRFTPQYFGGKSFVVNISINGLVQYESSDTFNIIANIMYFAE